MKISPIDVTDKISKQRFYQNYFEKQKPLIIKGLISDCEASKKWNIDYLKKVCGDVMVDVFDNKNKNAATAFTKPDLKMKFADYVESIVTSDPVTLRVFLFNMFKHKPELRKDFPCPDLFKGILGHIGFMFFGAKGIKVRVHQDMDMSNVLLTQFHGRKKVLLIGPEYSRLLYKLPFNTHSLVDLDAPDYGRYPGLRYIEGYECVLEPGDSLFIPSGYWHYVTYVEGGFSVSYRKMAQSLKFKLQGLCYLCVLMPIDKILNRLFADKWLLKKEQIAARRAEHEISKIRNVFERAPVELPT
jgi:hypothetical protein